MILDTIAEKTRARYDEIEAQVPFAVIKEKALSLPKDDTFPFEAALRKDGVSFICEVKKASPSKGVIAEDFPYLEIAKEYEAAGASCISVLTEPYFFLGSDRYLTEIAEAVSIPVLRKDFTICPYQIYEAKVIGASAVLLICALLDTATLQKYLEIAHSLGLSAIVEAHTAEEVQSALEAGARIIGVNNRNLKTFEVDITTSLRLREMVPPEIVFLSESGISTREDVAALEQNGTDGVLIGERFMRSPNKREVLHRLRGDEI
jgi:indole-3-glycerol phosphate synthase